MFVTSISFRGTFKSFWDLTEVSDQCWYKVLTYELAKPYFQNQSIDRRCLFVFYAEHNNKIGRGLIGR